jgi:hypothetical protein
VSLMWEVSKGGSSMLCMCSTSPSNAENTRDASTEAILWEKFGFEIVEVAAARLKKQHSRPNTRKRPNNHIAMQHCSNAEMQS